MGLDTKLEETLVEKDLGVNIDNEFNFNFYIQLSIMKGNRMLGLIQQTYKYIDSQCMKLLYMALVRPHLEYGNVIRIPSLQGDITQLENIQRRASKLIPEVADMTYQERMAFLGIPSLAYR